MLDFLRSSKALVKDDICANTTTELAVILKWLRDSGKKVFIQFEGENVSYACNIGAFNLTHGVVVVSDLYSDIQPSTLQKGRAVNVSVRNQGRGLDIECSYVEPLVENKISSLQLAMPKHLSAEALESMRSLLAD